MKTKYVYNSNFVDKHHFAKNYVINLCKTCVFSGKPYSDVLKASHSVNNSIFSSDSTADPHRNVRSKYRTRVKSSNKFSCHRPVIKSDIVTKKNQTHSRVAPSVISPFTVQTKNRFSPLPIEGNTRNSYVEKNQVVSQMVIQNQLSSDMSNDLGARVHLGEIQAKKAVVKKKNNRNAKRQNMSDDNSEATVLNHKI